MNEQTEISNKGYKKKKTFRRLSTTKLIVAIIIVLVLMGTGIGLSKHFSTDGKTTKLGFENIGELATQSVTCTSVRVDNKDRSLFGVSIPFTKSKVIYSYDTVIKAGIDFGDVKWRIGNTNDTSKNIYVEIPQIKIISIDVDHNSFKLYHEDQSIFAPISLEEHNESMKELESTSEKDAIDNGLFDNALDNAKVLLTAFIGQVYNPNEYTIIFSQLE